MNGRFQMQGGKNWFLPKEMNENRFFWDSHWLEIWSNHFYPSMGPNGGSVAMDKHPGAATLSPRMNNARILETENKKINQRVAGMAPEIKKDCAVPPLNMFDIL